MRPISCADGVWRRRRCRRISGLDRVAHLRFDADWTASDRGKIATNGAHILGLRFPASDIPDRAREALPGATAAADRQRRTTARPRSSRRCNPLTGKPIDLSASVLRSVSPVHPRIYAQHGHDGVHVDFADAGAGRLGLISCHNRDPARVPYHVPHGLRLHRPGAVHAACRDRMRRPCRIGGDKAAARCSTGCSPTRRRATIRQG
jgi:light-regulated signal transduction histidine kinase (bacteriophytochrome)